MTYFGKTQYREIYEQMLSAANSMRGSNIAVVPQQFLPSLGVIYSKSPEGTVSIGGWVENDCSGSMHFVMLEEHRNSTIDFYIDGLLQDKPS